MEKTLRGDYNCYGLASPCPPIHGGPRNAFVLGRWRTLRETTTAYEPLEVAGSTEYHVDSDESVGECQALCEQDIYCHGFLVTRPVTGGWGSPVYTCQFLGSTASHLAAGARFSNEHDLYILEGTHNAPPPPPSLLVEWWNAATGGHAYLRPSPPPPHPPPPPPPPPSPPSPPSPPWHFLWWSSEPSEPWHAPDLHWPDLHWPDLHWPDLHLELPHLELPALPELPGCVGADGVLTPQCTWLATGVAGVALALAGAFLFKICCRRCERWRWERRFSSRPSRSPLLPNKPKWAPKSGNLRSPVKPSPARSPAGRSPAAVKPSPERRPPVHHERTGLHHGSTYGLPTPAPTAAQSRLLDAARPMMVSPSKPQSAPRKPRTSQWGLRALF